MSLGASKELFIWDTTTCSILGRWDANRWINDVRFNPDGSKLAMVESSHVLVMSVDSVENSIAQLWKAGGGDVRCTTFVPESSAGAGACVVMCGEGSEGRLVSYDGDGATAVVFDGGGGGDDEGEGGGGGAGHEEAINSIDCTTNRNGKGVVVTGANDCLVCCWDYETRACTHKVVLLS